MLWLGGAPQETVDSTFRPGYEFTSIEAGIVLIMVHLECPHGSWPNEEFATKALFIAEGTRLRVG
jgi:hypothetical protein